VPVFVLEMGGHLTGARPSDRPEQDIELDPVRAGDAGGAVGGLAVLRARLGIAQTRNLNMFTLIAMGTGVAGPTAWWRRSRPGSSRRRSALDGAVAVYFEAAAVITVLVLLGQVLELRARERTQRRSARCSIWRPRLRAASAPTAATRSHARLVGRRHAPRPPRREGAGRWRGDRGGRGRSMNRW
jgi:hypothetical protein